MKNTKWKYLGEAILFAIQLIAIFAIIGVLLVGPIILAFNFNNPHYFGIIYAFYGLVIVVAIIYSHIARGEYVEEAYTEGERIHRLISKYEAKGMRVVDHRMFGYKARVYYNKETNTITLT